jgi:hypothetical protein
MEGTLGKGLLSNGQHEIHIGVENIDLGFCGSSIGAKTSD